MILESLKYTRFRGKTREWTVVGKDDNPVHFGNINLIVGKNSVGKSRTLALIGDIANVLGLRKNITEINYPDWKYTIDLKEDDHIYKYTLSVENDVIIEESLWVDGVEKYNRAENKIYSETRGTFDKPEISDTEVIISLHQNEEYPFLEEIFEWGNALRKYGFTNQYEKNRLLEHDEIEMLKNNEDFDPDNIIQLFYTGAKEFGKDFTDSIIADMQRLEYIISRISIEKNKSGSGISVKEEELQETTSQIDMSQGMFRALSFIIQLNYALFCKTSVCLLIDDLGEGLDFSRSKSLIDMLIHKINDSNIQVFITTNDRYVMNKIPIRYWSILDRHPKTSIIYNYRNSQETFDDFKYTGLNNFDFLATDFYLKGFAGEEEEEREEGA